MAYLGISPEPLLSENAIMNGQHVKDNHSQVTLVYLI
jgi:hypothetical protein